MVVSLGQASACLGTDLVKRPRSPSPIDSPTDIKISKIAHSILTREAAFKKEDLERIKNDYAAGGGA